MRRMKKLIGNTKGLASIIFGFIVGCVVVILLISVYHPEVLTFGIEIPIGGTMTIFSLVLALVCIKQ